MEDDHEDNEDNQFFFSHAPRMPEDDIIMSEVAILTGGRDQHGRPIVTFPAKYHGIMESKVKASGMDTLLRYFVEITRPEDRKRGFAFVTDLRFDMLDFVLLLKSILNSLQTEMTGIIGTCVLYVILPLNKKTCKDTLTHLALRQSKKKINKSIVPPYFQSIAVKDEMELFNYIEKSHLTSDLGGYLQYSHQEWVAFRQAVEPFFPNFEYVHARLPNTFQQLAAMANIRGGNNKEQLQKTYNQLQEAYYDIRTSLHLYPTLEQCEQLLQRFRCLDEDDVFTILAQRPIFKETKDVVEGCHAILKDAKRKIDEEWKTLLSRITEAIQLVDYRTEVVKLLDWFKTRTEQELQQGPDIADSLSRAEMLWNHFKTGLLTKTQEKLARSRALVQEGDSLVGNSHHRTSEIATLARTLQQNAEDFEKILQKHQRALQSVYRFYQLYNKARRWYIKCVKFLPSDLRDLYSNIRSQRHDDRALQLQWEEDVRRFVHKNPLLEKEELKNMKMVSDDIGNSSLRKKGRLLSYRCLILNNLLSHSKKTTSADISDILKWCSEIHSHSEDSASHQSEILPSSDRLKRVSSSTSLDTPQESKRHRKPDRKGRSQTAVKTNDRNAGLMDRTVRGLDRSSDRLGTQHRTHYDVGNQTESDDPLVRRLEQVQSFYDQFRGTQLDEVDYGRKNRTDGPNNDGSEYPTQQSIGPRTPTPNLHAIEHAQKYGIYGYSDIDDETAVLIHDRGPPHGFPENLLPGNQNHKYSHSYNQQLQMSTNLSSVVNNRGTEYGLVHDGQSQIQHDISSTARYSGNLYHPAQHPVADLQPVSLGPQIVHQSDLPSNYTTNNSNFTGSQTPPYYFHPQRTNANDMTSSPHTPMSFHGSLMNIHESHAGDASLDIRGYSPNLTVVGNSSPITRHRSLVNLSRSSMRDETSLNGFTQTQMPPDDLDLQQTSSLRDISSHGFQDFYEEQNLKLNESLPSTRTLPDGSQTSPYQAVLRKLDDVRSRNDARVAQLVAKSPTLLHSAQTRHSPSKHVLSRSEMDLRDVPKGRTPTLPTRSVLSSSRQGYHSETNLHQPAVSSQNLGSGGALVTLQNTFSGSDFSSEQAEYYRRLNSVSHRTIPGSGGKVADDALNPSVHTWTHAIPSANTNTSTQFTDIPTGARALSPLALLEMEVAMETTDAKAAIQSEQYNEEQLIRQSAVDGILGQSQPGSTSHDHTFRDDSKLLSKTPVTDAVVCSMGKPHRRKMLKSSTKAEKYEARNGQSELSKDRHAINLPSKLKAGNATKPELLDSRASARVSFSQEDDIDSAESRRGRKGSRALKSTTSTSRNATSKSNQRRRPNLTHRIADAEYKFGVTTTLPQVPNLAADKTSTRHSRVHFNAVNNERSHEYALGSHEYASGDASSRVLGEEGRNQKLGVNWRQEHLKELGLVPNGVHDLDHTMAEHSKSTNNLASLYEPNTDHKQEHLLNYGISPSMHHTISNQVLTNDNPRTGSHDKDWRHQHLLDLGISPSMNHSTSNQGSTNDNPPTGSHDKDWRHQHLLDLGISPSMNHSTSNQGSTNDNPPTGSHDKDWRHQHLLDLGISPSMNHSTSNQGSTNDNPPTGSHNKDWRHHLLDQGKSPSMHLSTSNQGSTNDNPPTGSHDKDWRHQHLLHLGISPSMHQHPVSDSLVPSSTDNIAPMTDKLRGVIRSGRSLIDMKEFYETTDEINRKSVRFAQLSDSVLDAEEQAQDELAHRLHQVELNLQAEEDSLKYKDVLVSEQASLDRQLQELDNIEKLQMESGQRKIGQVVSEDTVRPATSHSIKVSSQPIPETRLLLDSGSSHHQDSPTRSVRYEGALHTTRVAVRSPNKASSVGSVKQASQEGALQPAHDTKSSPNRTGSVRSDQTMLEGAVPPKTKPLSPKSTKTESYIPESYTKKTATNKKTSPELKTSPRMISALNPLKSWQYSKPTRDEKEVSDTKDGTKTDASLESPPGYQPSRTLSNGYTENVNNQQLLGSQVFESNSPGPKAGIQTVGPGIKSGSADSRRNRASGERELIQPRDLMNADITAHNAGLKRRSLNHEPGFSTQSSVPTTDNHAILTKDHNLESAGNHADTGQDSFASPPSSQDIFISDGFDQESMANLNSSADSDIFQSSLNSAGCSRDVQSHHDGVRQEDEFDDIRRTETQQISHTAADYIACALGLDYVSDKSHLSVKPFKNVPISSQDDLNNLDNEDKDLSEVDEAFLKHTPEGHRKTNLGVRRQEGELNVHQTSSDVENGIPSTNFNDSLRNGDYPWLSTSPVRTEDKPSSVPLWPKDKHITKSESDLRIAVKDPAAPTREVTGKNKTQQLSSQIMSTSLRSRSALPIKEWLKEREIEEANADTTHGLKTVNQSSDGLRDKLANSFKSSPIGSEKMMDTINPETTDEKAVIKTTPAISDHKGLDGLSRPKQNETSSPRNRATRSITTNSTSDDMDTSVEQHQLGSKKENRFKQIPVDKVYSALKDGGYIGKPQPQDESRLEEDNVGKSVESSEGTATENEKLRPGLQRQETFTVDPKPSLERRGTFTKDPRPALTREGTFTSEMQDETESGNAGENFTEASLKPVGASENGQMRRSSVSPLALVLDHMVKKGSEAKSVRSGKKRHDSSDEPFENSSTESSASPSALIISRKPTMNLYSTKKYYLNVQNGGGKSEVTGSKAIGHEGEIGAYEGLTESDRREHDDLDDSELEKLILSKSQLAEIRNLEIENRHLAYEKKEFEAHLIRNMQQQTNALQET